MINGVLKNYKNFLNISPSTPDITLGEGSTPLVKSRHIAAILGCKDLYFKLEGCNPTGSFKDRGMVVAVAKAMDLAVKQSYVRQLAIPVHQPPHTVPIVA